jgi:hypothetical protein
VQDSPTYFIKKLTSAPTNELVKDLRVQLSTQPVAWYKKFRDSKGVDVLLDLLGKVDQKYRNKPEGFRLQNEVLRTLKACFHSKVNVEDFATDGGRLKKLVLSIDAGDESVRALTYELLGLIALFADEGPNHLGVAFDFLRYTRSVPHRFKTLIDALRLESSVELIANALVLVNAIINTPEELDERMALRLEMLGLGLDQALSELHRKHSEKTTSGVHKDILAQIETYQGDVEHDQEEYSDRLAISTSGRKVNFRDPKELFMGLMAHIKDKDHIIGGFYSVMKHLLDMPTDKTRGPKLWWAVAKVVQQLTFKGKEQVHLEGDRLVDIDDLLAATADKVELERQKEESFVKIETLAAEIETLKHQVKVANDKAITGGASSEAVKLLEVAKLKLERALDEKKKDLDELKKMADDEKRDADGARSSLSLQLAELREKNAALNQQFTDLKDRLKDTRRTLERTTSYSISADKEDLVRNVMELQRDNADLHKQVDAMKKEQSSKQAEDVGQLLAEIEKLRKKLSETELRQLETSATVTSQTEKEKNLISKIDDINRELENVKIDNASLKDLIAAAKAPVVNVVNNAPSAGTESSTSASSTSDSSVDATAAGGGPPAPGPPPPGPPPPGPPPPPGGGSGGPPGPPPPGGMKKAPATPVGPKPKVPMKNFLWSKLAAAQAAKSVFKDMDISKVELDLSALETQFGAKVIEQKPKAGEGGVGGGSLSGTPTKKETLVSFVDSKRLQNIGIFVQTFKHTYRDMAEAILMVNEEVVNAEMATKLMDNAPLPEEITQIVGFINGDGSVDKLQNVDKFFYQLSFVPQLVPRLSSIAFKLNFESKATELKVAALRVKKANRELDKAAPGMKKLLEYVLALGNFLNNGTARGNAGGFQLASLTQMLSTKSTDNKTTLLEYMVAFFQANKAYEAVTKLPEDLNGLQLATKVNWSVLQGDLQELRKSYTEIRALAATITKSGHKLDVFIETIVPALESFDTTLIQEELQFKEIDEQYSQLSALYGTSAQSVPPEEFYATLSNFLTAFDKAAKQTAVNKEKAEKEARRIKLDEAKKANEAKKVALAAAKEAQAKTVSRTSSSASSSSVAAGGASVTASTSSSSLTSSPNKTGSTPTTPRGEDEDDDLESIVSSARGGASNRFRKTQLRRQETLRAQRASEVKR